MLAKRQRGDGLSSSPSKSYDKKKFINLEASDKYSRMAHKRVIPERDLRVDQNQDGEIVVMIAERHWFDLIAQPDPAMISVVKEFYANAKEHYHFRVQVRGKTISFSSTDINAYYNLSDIGNVSQYTSFVS